MSEGNDDSRPWLSDPRYGGMSALSAERSYRAAAKRRDEAFAFQARSPEEYGHGGPPPPKSLADYGLSPDCEMMPFTADVPPIVVRATPYKWVDPTTIPRRDYIY